MCGPRITSTEKKTYQYHTDDSILGIRLLSSLSNDVLQSIRRESKVVDHDHYGDPTAPFTAAVLLLMGGKTNPNWIAAQAYETLQDRGEVE